MTKVCIEVGANKGTDTIKFLNQGYNVYAFEPTPELIVELKNKLKSFDNYFPVNMAADLYNGWSWFNIAGPNPNATAQGYVVDWGCSSLYDFNDKITELWPGRPDFQFTDKCKVQTIRLDTFMQVYGLSSIDYLWVDAQGNDFRVLQSLGHRIIDVKAGRCEGALTVSLYNADNSAEKIAQWLQEKGFNTEFQTQNGKEADVLFERI